MNKLSSRLQVVCMCIMVLAFALSSPAQAADATNAPAIKTELETRAERLLDVATRHIELKGEAGTHDFGRQSDFVDRDLYAYALRVDGVFLASGGSSAVLVGENVTDQTDSDGKPFFREMIETALRDGHGRVEYRWYNPADSRGEPKLTLFRKVGEIIVAVGFYPPRATPVEARALLSKAVDAVEQSRDAALASFQDLGSPFLRNDLYVFVVDVASGRILAHGATPALIGTDGLQVRDHAGTPIIVEMIRIAREKGAGELAYSWPNPVTGRVESKHSFFRSHQGLLIGVGSYTR